MLQACSSRICQLWPCSEPAADNLSSRSAAAALSKSGMCIYIRSGTGHSTVLVEHMINTLL